MRPCVPLFVGVSVHVTTVFSLFAATSPEAFQAWESRLLGSTTRTSQSVTPFQCAMGVARKLNVTHDRLKVVLHQPLLYQRALSERAPVSRSTVILSPSCGSSLRSPRLSLR